MPFTFTGKIPACTLLVAAWICACVGCGQTDSISQSQLFVGIDQQYVEKHGQLYFVNDVKVGCQLASERGMPCLFFFTAKWCTLCHRMADTTFGNEQVGLLGQSFVCVLVDADRDTELRRYFGVTGFPTVEFASPQGQSLHRLVGQQSPSDLAGGMQAALGRFTWINDSQLR